jgi:hypothetical protein
VPAYVLEAEIQLQEGCDPRAVGAAVTVELCGHWEHEGPCTWPHNSATDTERSPALFRTIYVADEQEEPEIRDRIERSLKQADEWRVIAVRSRPVSADERELADRLASGPRRPR